ncbi:L-rhamnose mutarotase [Arthrobacter bambusae]|jgi:L-rhamnose mutarotase|uniref:L-rhamnose mutarotase n=1 Tax=Arthrobacter bambusae TaxID=1338426 RepID=UPI00278B793B|nr:L-rhamnose mutarotase [Arthrobacter bambusae]MDQ0210223.1 L-rhamnose mutarotase [Arthrobacter bambusae]MDQ0234673.1 L-rhamnose mutarotase [Arthrobacter bambusae]
MRVCFRSSVKPSQIPEYRRRHAAVWPEMLQELKVAGWKNYSLFLADDGLLVGYVECDDFDAVRARMALSEVNSRWQAEMALLFEDDRQAPDEGFLQLTEIFNLEDQLSKVNSSEGNQQAQKEQQ